MKNKSITVDEIEEFESRKAMRKFRNRYLTGAVIVPVVKWTLIAIGVSTVVGAFSHDSDNKNESEEI
jgi:hypothetical protein